MAKDINEVSATKPAKAVKKAPAKKVAAPKAAKVPGAEIPAPVVAETVKAPAAALTTIVAKVDIGFGNTLFLRGTGAGLSWDKGVEMTNTAADEWTWSTTKAGSDFLAKVLVNDVTWANEPDATIVAGTKTVLVPTF